MTCIPQTALWHRSHSRQRRLGSSRRSHGQPSTPVEGTLAAPPAKHNVGVKTQAEEVLLNESEADNAFSSLHEHRVHSCDCGCQTPYRALMQRRAGVAHSTNNSVGTTPRSQVDGANRVSLRTSHAAAINRPIQSSIICRAAEGYWTRCNGTSVGPTSLSLKWSARCPISPGWCGPEEQMESSKSL